MIKAKKNFVLTILLTVAVLILSISCCFINGNSANAAVKDDSSNEAQPYGLVTNISLSLGANSEVVWAKAHNDFTLGMSTVQVYVYLYSSLEYQDDYNQMTLENSAYIYDLDIHKSLEVSAPINGVQKYWKARVEFKLDNKDWNSKETKTYLIDTNGKVVG
ncbi:MAG: hypothetical protein HDT32_06660 [Clostridiales bacterium]|nr:hypothetical protein [Clostridiales bacterium]